MIYYVHVLKYNYTLMCLVEAVKIIIINSVYTGANIHRVDCLLKKKYLYTYIV